MPPLPEHGMERCGVDNLHLIHLNCFKHYFTYTVHEGLPNSKKEINHPELLQERRLLLVRRRLGR